MYLFVVSLIMVYSLANTYVGAASALSEESPYTNGLKSAYTHSPSKKASLSQPVEDSLPKELLLPSVSISDSSAALPSSSLEDKIKASIEAGQPLHLILSEISARSQQAKTSEEKALVGLGCTRWYIDITPEIVAIVKVLYDSERGSFSLDAGPTIIYHKEN